MLIFWKLVDETQISKLQEYTVTFKQNLTYIFLCVRVNLKETFWGWKSCICINYKNITKFIFNFLIFHSHKSLTLYAYYLTTPQPIESSPIKTYRIFFLSNICFFSYLMSENPYKFELSWKFVLVQEL